MSFICLPDSKERPHRESGFSMVELVATTSILLLAAGMATYSLQGFMRSYRAQSDARSIASQVSLARMRAASAFRDTRIVFDQANRTYQMQVMVDRLAGT